ncbi:MAG: energy transducer TonB [Candidatus Aminicenantes bacterium]|nr:energy transducer TonB [Candidatus Aminicenantes bacterium]
MFQDALFVPQRHLRDKAAALPAAVLIHAVALTLLLALPLLRVGELPEVDISGVIVVPALPAPPLAPPKARTGNPGARIRKRAFAPAAEAWRTPPVDVPVGIIEEAGFGAEGSEFGVPGGVDYVLRGGGLSANLLGAGLYGIIGEAEPVVRAVGEVKPPKLFRRVEPDYPVIAKEARIQGIVILEATTDIHGRVTAVRVLQSVPLLDEAAVVAVKQWVYEPLMVNGRPRPVTFTVTVRFVLK